MKHEDRAALSPEGRRHFDISVEEYLGRYRRHAEVTGVLCPPVGFTRLKRMSLSEIMAKHEAGAGRGGLLQ